MASAGDRTSGHEYGRRAVRVIFVVHDLNVTAADPPLPPIGVTALGAPGTRSKPSIKHEAKHGELEVKLATTRKKRKPC